MRNRLTRIVPIAFPIAVGAIVWSIGIARALPSAEITIAQRSIAATTAVGAQPEVLVFDVTISADRSDVLDALFVRQDGTAVFDRDLTGAQLWGDAGSGGFQGSGVDRLLGRGVWDAEENGWVFDRVFAAIPEDGARFFVTVATAVRPASQTTIQLRIPSHRDAFRRMSYDRGDLGVFLRTARPAPIVAVTGPLLTITPHVSDDLAPIARITEPENGASAARDWLIVRGVAWDIGGSAVASVRVGVNRTGRSITWVDAVPEVPGHATWEARFFEFPTPETYEFRVQASDWNGNVSAVSEPITIELRSEN